VRTGFREVNLRIDKVIENTGVHWRELRERVERLERHAGIALDP
jgi:hypothetical protein